MGLIINWQKSSTGAEGDMRLEFGCREKLKSSKLTSQDTNITCEVIHEVQISCCGNHTAKPFLSTVI